MTQAHMQPNKMLTFCHRGTITVAAMAIPIILESGGTKDGPSG